MWFDPDEAQRPFETGLLGYNPWSFAYHLEPDRYRSLTSIKAPQAAHYERFVPKTSAIAEGLFEKIRQRRVWGTQIAPGSWSYEQMGEQIKTPTGFRHGDALVLRDVLKHLTGRAGYARGTTDRPIEQFEYDFKLDRWLPNFVPYLRLDVDQPRFWHRENETAVLDELRAQRRVVSAFGLPYRVFRTGGKGVQMVVPLPVAVPPCLASILLHCLRSALEARGSGFASTQKELDKDNLSGLMRLPGGIHASSWNLGLWIDVENGRLFDLPTQAEMMVSAWDYPREDSACLSPEAFDAACHELLTILEARRIALHEVLARDCAFEVLYGVPNNVLSQANQCASREALAIRAEYESLVYRPTALQEAPAPVDVRRNAAAEAILDESDLADGVNDEEHAPFGTVEWAKRVWTQAYEPGGHWDWINMAGQRGILAAAILFGEDGAEDALIALARSIDALSPSERREREHTIRGLWTTFGWKSFKPFQPTRKETKATLISGALDQEIENLAGQIVSEMLRTQPKPRWSRELARKVAITLLIGIRDSEQGRLRSSFGAIAESVNTRWPDSPTNRQRVAEMIPRMCQKKGTLIKAFFRVPGRRWMSESDEYGCGRLLRGSELERRSAQMLAEWQRQRAADFGEEEE